MSDRSKDALSRRDFLRTGLAAGALVPVAGLVLRAPAAWAEDEKLVTETPAAAATVQALQYKNESDKPDQNCANCQFYTPGSGGTGTGSRVGLTAGSSPLRWANRVMSPPTRRRGYHLYSRYRIERKHQTDCEYNRPPDRRRNPLHRPVPAQHGPALLPAGSAREASSV